MSERLLHWFALMLGLHVKCDGKPLGWAKRVTGSAASAIRRIARQPISSPLAVQSSHQDAVIPVHVPLEMVSDLHPILRSVEKPDGLQWVAMIIAAMRGVQILVIPMRLSQIVADFVDWHTAPLLSMNESVPTTSDSARRGPCLSSTQ